MFQVFLQELEASSLVYFLMMKVFRHKNWLLSFFQSFLFLFPFFLFAYQKNQINIGSLILNLSFKSLSKQFGITGLLVQDRHIDGTYLDLSQIQYLTYLQPLTYSLKIVSINRKSILRNTIFLIIVDKGVIGALKHLINH